MRRGRLGPLARDDHHRRQPAVLRQLLEPLEAGDAIQGDEIEVVGIQETPGLRELCDRYHLGLEPGLELVLDMPAVFQLVLDGQHTHQVKRAHGVHRSPGRVALRLPLPRVLLPPLAADSCHFREII